MTGETLENLHENQASGSPPKKVSPLTPFRHRNFSLLFGGQIISTLGDAAYTIALPWTVLATTGSASQMALVLAIAAVARTAMLMLGGTIADRTSPRVVMLAADAGRAIVVGALGVIFFVGLPPFWIVALLAGLQGVGSGLFGPSSIAIIPATVEHDEIPSASGVMQVGGFLSMVIGPALGGVATAAQASLAFLLDGGSFLVSALSLGFMRPTRKDDPPAATRDEPSREKKSLLGEMGDGLRYAVRDPLLRTTMSVTVLGNLGIAGIINVALIVLSRNLSNSPITLGLLLAGLGVGGIIGGLSVAFVARLKRRAVIALVTWLFMGLILSAIPFVAGAAGRLPWQLIELPTDQRLYMIGGLLAIAGFILGLGDTVLIGVMQQKIAPEFMGRVFSLQLTMGSILQPVSMVVAGVLTAAYGPGIVFLIGSGILTIGILFAFTSKALREA